MFCLRKKRIKNPNRSEPVAANFRWTLEQVFARVTVRRARSNRVKGAQEGLLCGVAAAEVRFLRQLPPKGYSALFDEQLAAVDALGHALGFGCGACGFLILVEVAGSISTAPMDSVTRV